MSELDLEAIKARCEATTPEPWEVDGPWAEDVMGPDEWLAECHHARDAAFIAAARTDIPALVAEVERLRAALKAMIEAERLRATLKEIAHEN